MKVPGPEIILIVHNVRSCHNVGSLLRTAEGFGVANVYLSGYTPYPKIDDDPRLPHLADKISTRIRKTALGAEETQAWEPITDLAETVGTLKKDGFVVVALEQAKTSQSLVGYNPPAQIAIIVGREVEGLEEEVLALCDTILEIPMFGKKESFNVVQAAAMAIYQVRFHGH